MPYCVAVCDEVSALSEFYYNGGVNANSLMLRKLHFTFFYVVFFVESMYRIIT